MGEEVTEGRVPSAEDAGNRKVRKVVGYIEGRGGVETATPDDALAEWESEGAGAAALLGDLYAEAQQIELAMAEVKKLLRLSQPPMWGRYSVRWWRPTTGSRRTPMLIREQAGAKGRITPERVKTRGAKQRVDRGFSLNADLAKEAVDTYWLLWHNREAALAEIRRVKLALAGDKQKRRDSVARLSERMKVLQAEAEKRLDEIGGME